jgi:hypothetical protein
VINAKAMFLGLFEDEWDAAKAFNTAVTAAGKSDRLNCRVSNSTDGPMEMTKAFEGSANPAQQIPLKRNRPAVDSVPSRGAQQARRRARSQTAVLAQHQHNSGASSHHDPAPQMKLSKLDVVDLLDFSQMANGTLPPPLPKARPLSSAGVAFMGLETAAFVRSDCETRTLEMNSEPIAPPIPVFPTNLWRKPKPCTNRSDISNLVT